jgi:hypothetical protein
VTLLSSLAWWAYIFICRRTIFGFKIVLYMFFHSSSFGFFGRAVDSRKQSAGWFNLPLGPASLTSLT